MCKSRKLELHHCISSSGDGMSNKHVREERETLWMVISNLEHGGMQLYIFGYEEAPRHRGTGKGTENFDI